MSLIPPRWCTGLWWVLVISAVTDIVYAPAVLAGAWWLGYLVLWIAPWQSINCRPSSFKKALHFLSVIFLFSWLIYRTQEAALYAIFDWTFETSVPRLSLFAYVGQTVLAAIFTAIVLAVPLRKVAGVYATRIAVIAAVPFAVIMAGDAWFHPSQWIEHPLRHAFLLFDCIMPMLVIAEATSLLHRYSREQLSIESGKQSSRSLDALLAGRLNVIIAAVLCGLAWICMSRAQEWLAPSNWFNPSPLEIGVYALGFPMMALLFFASVIVARRSLTRAGRRVSALRKYAAKAARATLAIAVTLIGLQLVVDEAPLTGALISEALILAGKPAWSIAPTINSGEIKITGELQRGIARALEWELDNDPLITQVELNSLGGSVLAGYALAQLIEQRSLSTIVRDACASACTIAFVAARDRRIEGGAKLGFHAYKPIRWSDTPETFFEHFELHGVDAKFVRKGFEVPHEDMWYPDIDELLAAGVISRESLGPGQFE